MPIVRSFFFFFNDTATTEIYTLSLHDALPISRRSKPLGRSSGSGGAPPSPKRASEPDERDRKSTRLNSSHSQISYAVFCLKKKKKNKKTKMLNNHRVSDNHEYDTHNIVIHYLS